MNSKGRQENLQEMNLSQAGNSPRCFQYFWGTFIQLKLVKRTDIMYFLSENPLRIFIAQEKVNMLVWLYIT
jgi:hypothetical protein